MSDKEKLLLFAASLETDIKNNKDMNPMFKAVVPFLFTEIRGRIERDPDAMMQALATIHCRLTEFLGVEGDTDAAPDEA